MNHQKQYHFCNNCGKQGHIFGSCKLPITSLGVVAFKKEDNIIKYLLICRKDSLGFIEFLRGKYPLYDKDYILNLINEMTQKEKNLLQTKSFEDLWILLWGNFIGIQYRQEEKHAKEKYIQIKRGINTIDEGNYDLSSLLEESINNWKTPEWGFPKGRRNYQETDMKCAFREFNEETGYESEKLDLISNISPFEEIFMGSNYKIYKHKYYLGYFRKNEYMDDDISIGMFQKSEVSDMRWGSYEEAIELIRPYNIEKINMLDNINKTLLEYRLIS